MRTIIVMVILYTTVFCGCRIDAPSSETVKEKDSALEQGKDVKILLFDLLDKKIDAVSVDTIKHKNCAFTILSNSTDSIITVANNRIKRINASIEKYCNEGCEIVTELNVKSYVANSFISILYKEYFDCKSMPAPSSSSGVINLILFQGKLYEIKMKNSSDILRFVDSTIKNNFEVDCLNEYEGVDSLDIYIENGKFFINNALRSKVCDEPIEVTHPSNKIEFVETND